jgi:hypothetical protein
MDKQGRTPDMNRSSRTRFAWLSIAAAMLAIAARPADDVPTKPA